MATLIHKNAVVDEAAQLGENVQIGPGAVVGPGVIVGDGTHIMANAVIEKNVTLGRDNKIFPNACIGTDPQDLKFKGEKSFVVIGDRNHIRECVTIQPGVGEGETTHVGSDNLFMAYTHVAHNCRMGSHVVLANCATIAGHAVVEDWAIVGGLSGVHQFARIGTHAMVGALARLSKDVLPYSTTSGTDEVKVYGLNKVGLRRREFSREAIKSLEEAFRILQNTSKMTTEAVEDLRSIAQPSKEVQYLLKFIETSGRGFYR